MRTKMWKLHNSGQFPIYFRQFDLDRAKQHVINKYPERYYGCNISEVDEFGNNIPDGDFACIAVERYYRRINEEYGTPLPVPLSN